MELTFKQSSQLFGKEYGYEAEFEATADFNLHIERKAGGALLFYQKGIADGEYDIVDNDGYFRHKAVIDLDFTALVYPKWIKVVSEVEVTMGVVTFNA
jgi:hypothetical protein